MAGNTFDIVVLSSSPPEVEREADVCSLTPPNAQSPQRVTMPAPSCLSLSPTASKQKTTSGALKSGSRATPIPPEAIRGFATVRSIFPPEQLEEQLEGNTGTRQSAQTLEGVLFNNTDKPKTTKNRTKKSKVSTKGDDDKPKTKPSARKSQTNNEDGTRKVTSRKRAPVTSSYFPAADTEDADSKAPATNEASAKTRKPRAKKIDIEKTENTSKNKKTGKAKPKKTSKVSSETQCEEPCNELEYFGDNQAHTALITGDTGNSKTEVESIWDVPQSPRPQDLELEPAIQRRREWTPPVNTEALDVCTDTDAASKENDFTDIVSHFAYEQNDSVSFKPGAELNSYNPGVMKRRRVELLDLPGHSANSRNSSPEKGKAPKKKARTITDLVTGQYSVNQLEQDHLVNTNDHPLQTNPIRLPLNDNVVEDSTSTQKKPTSKRSSSKASGEKREKRSKAASAKAAAKAKLVADKLLSPSSAMQRMNKQDILFGTSSQLALDESPAMLRQIQRAMEQSEQDSGAPSRFVPMRPKLTKAEGKRSLWNASNRNEEGGLLEKLEDVYIPEPDRSLEPLLLRDATQATTIEQLEFVDIDDIEPPQLKAKCPEKCPPPHVSSDAPRATLKIIKNDTLKNLSFEDTDDIELPQVNTVSSGLLSLPRVVSQTSRAILKDAKDGALKDLSFEDIDNYVQEPPPSNQNVESQNSFYDIDDFDLPPPTRFAAPQQAHSIPTSSSKKKRDEVVDFQSAPSHAPSHNTLQARAHKAPQPSTPHKTKGRFTHVEEILDSEDEALEALSPTPPRVRTFQELPSLSLAPITESSIEGPTEQSPVPVFRIPSADLQWQTVKSLVFSAITLYVRNLPPTTNTQNPSWYEKMLMYDPIILEDFTKYINSNADIRTYRRATKIQIKSWNKKLKASGEAVLKVQDEDDEVLAIHKELEPWMVQAWCQEMSVCCVWGQNRGRAHAHFGQSFY